MTFLNTMSGTKGHVSTKKLTASVAISLTATIIFSSLETRERATSQLF